MQFNSIKRNLFLGMFFIGGFLFAQDDDPIGSETVVVIKPYTPSVGDVFKIKENPPSGDSLGIVKKEVVYNINSVPVASTFEPAKGRAANLERERPPKVYDSYATLGFGSYTSVLAEFYTNFEINKTDNFGVFLNHNSSQGGIDEVVLDDAFYNTDFNLNYASRTNERTWKAEAGVKHRLFNWYGLPGENEFTEEQINSIDPQQNYLDVYFGADVSFEDSFFKNASLDFNNFSDSYSSTENHAVLKPTFEFEIADELITTTLVADYLNGSFDQDFFDDETAIDYGYLNAGLNPSLLILRDDLTLNLGVAAFYSMDMENSNNKVFVYPRVAASYRLVGEYLIPYAGLEGDLEQNTYNKLSQENPFLSPSQFIAPTNKQYNGYLGLKGKITNSVNFNFRGSYVSEKNKPFFTANPAFSSSSLSNFTEMDNYMHGNSFGLVYDDLKTFSVFGGLNVDLSRKFSFGLNAEYLSYNTSIEEEAWNLPDMKASLLLDYQISDKWFTGANVFFRGERQDRRLIVENPGIPEDELLTYTLDSYIDANFHLGYRFNNQLSAFLRGNNLLGNNYQKWLDYPVQGLQVMAGATYKFDF